MPGNVGGAATKIRDLIHLLESFVDIRIILPNKLYLKNKELLRQLNRLPCSFTLIDDLKKSPKAICLSVCETAFFKSGHATKLKDLGYKIIFSNEMMWPFVGEQDACKNGVIDKVLYVSKFQREAFAEVNSGTEFSYTSNYIHADLFPFVERSHWPLAIGRISRADPEKYSENFPAFYESICSFDANFRIMGWDAKCAAKFNWFNFGTRWELLNANAKPVAEFLAQIDFFVYTTDRKLRESWGRAIVEAMLTGCIPLVPTGHAFDEFIISGETGYICFDAIEFRSILSMLYRNAVLKNTISRRAAEVAKHIICDPSKHKEIWMNALFG